MSRHIGFYALFFLLVHPFGSTATARELVFGKGKETVLVAFGVETLFRFPLEVKTITEASRFEIRPTSADDPDYSVLVVKPRLSQGASDVTFILSDGTVIRTQLIVSNKPNLKRDSIYDFKPREEMPESNPNSLNSSNPLVISELDLLRAMIRRDTVSGFEISRPAQSINLGVPDVTASLVKVYSGHAFNGYIYQLKTDATKRKFEINLKGLGIGRPNLAVLAQSDRTHLGGKSPQERETYLRIVARPGAASYKVILPIAIEGSSAKTKLEGEVK